MGSSNECRFCGKVGFGAGGFLNDSGVGGGGKRGEEKEEEEEGFFQGNTSLIFVFVRVNGRRKRIMRI